MSAFVILDSVCLATPDGRPLFNDLTLSVGRERVGVVGRNGSGKSSLLHLIAGERAPTAGSLYRAAAVGLLAQDLDARISVAEALGVAEGLARLHRLDAGNGSLADAADADWTLEARIYAALTEVGVSGAAMDRLVGSFSGGERMRLALARLLIAQPKVLLLDEPTNNLDADGRQAVVHLLRTWRGGVVVVSHDRGLLEQMDRIVELTPVGVTVFGGPWSAFAAAREAARERSARTVERTASSLKRAEREAQQAREKQDRRDKAGRAKRARGDAPKILLGAQAERAENTAARGNQLGSRLVGEAAAAATEAASRLEVLTPLAIDLPKPGVPPSRSLLVLDEVLMDHDDRRLFGPLSLEVHGPERIALRGANGSGKTTLLKLIDGELTPSGGEVRRLTKRIAKLDQHVEFLEPQATVLDNLRRLNPGISEQSARATLARFAFRNQAALSFVAGLSGGERVRAGLACLFARPDPPELLLLDEPTNHLDLAATEVLERALVSYDGALIVVSHDETFLEAIGARRDLRLA